MQSSRKIALELVSIRIDITLVLRNPHYSKVLSFQYSSTWFIACFFPFTAQLCLFELYASLPI